MLNPGEPGALMDDEEGGARLRHHQITMSSFVSNSMNRQLINNSNSNQQQNINNQPANRRDSAFNSILGGSFNED
jgi:hypothetical protein